MFYTFHILSTPELFSLKATVEEIQTSIRPFLLFYKKKGWNESFLSLACFECFSDAASLE